MAASDWRYRSAVATFVVTTVSAPVSQGCWWRTAVDFKLAELIDGGAAADGTAGVPAAAVVDAFGGAATGAAADCDALVPISGALACCGRSRNHHPAPPATISSNAIPASAMTGADVPLADAVTVLPARAQRQRPVAATLTGMAPRPSLFRPR